MGIDRLTNVRRFLTRILVIWAVEFLALLLFDRLYPGIHLGGALSAVIAVVVISLLNALLWTNLLCLSVNRLKTQMGIGENA